MRSEKQRPPADDQGGADDDSGVGSSLPTAADIAPAYVVVVVSPHGNPRRRVYLSLNHAPAAVARARGKGQPAWLVLCELRAVTADLGEVAP